MPPKLKGGDPTFKKGEKVKARWSGSNLYYDAKVLDLYSKHCKVQFDDGSVFSVKLSDIKVAKADSDEDFVPRSTRGSRSRSRSKSAGRKTQSRSRSPARTTRDRKEKTEKKASSEKKSSTEKKSVSEKKSSSERKSTSKDENKSKKSEGDSNSLATDETDRAVRSTRSSERSSLLTTTVTKNNISIKEVYVDRELTPVNAVHVRASSRLAAIQASKSEERSADFRSSPMKQNAVSKDSSKYSDDEDEEMEVLVVENKPKRILQAVFFLMTVLKIVLIPGSLLFLIFACSRKQCTILEVPPFYTRWKDFEYSMRKPFLAVMAFHAVQCMLSFIPLGRKVKGFPSDSSEVPKEYRLNGFINLILCCVVFGVCSYFGISMNWVFDKFRSIAMSSVIYCILWSLALHLIAHFKGDGTKSSKVPLIGGFYDGCYVNPVVFKVIDVKTTFIRSGLIGLVLLNSSILLKFILSKGYVTTPLALTASMQIFFVADMLFREEKLLSTAMYSSDGVGYSFLLTTGFFLPFSLLLQNVFNFINATNPVTTPHWCSAAMVCLYFCGYYIYMTSSNMKHNFRRNPYCPSLTDVDSIPTSKKKRLICSSWWKLVRHPNYLGLFIMAVAWTLPCGFSNFVPFGPLVLLTGALIIQSFRVENECKEKYGPAWQNYTSKVRSRLIPYVF